MVEILNALGRLKPRHWLQIGGGAVLVALLVAAFAFRGEILRAALDPKAPFQTYRPPPAPDYRLRKAWVLLPADPARPAASEPNADVFFIHPTTYNGGEEWNAPIDHPRSTRQLTDVMIPNYAGPFVRAGRLYAPRYRQASLYAMTVHRDDARDARNLAYEDVRRAFLTYASSFNRGRPFILAGVEQGGDIAARLLREEIVGHPELLQRLAGVYLIETVVPASGYGPGAPVPACDRREEARCVVAFRAEPRGDQGAESRVLHRALAWGEGEELEPMGGRPALCVNPMLGRTGGEEAGPRLNLGAANATDLEWGYRPAFLPHQVSAQCAGGLLRVSKSKSPSLKRVGGWADRQKAPGFNLFYLDLEADALARLKALRSDPAFHFPAPPITTSVPVRRAPVMGRR